MKNNFYYTALLLMPTLATQAQTKPNDSEIFPEPFIGVQVVPSNKMMSPTNSISNKQLKENGYIHSESENPGKLMAIKSRLPKNRVTLTDDPHYYYLRKNIEDIKLTFSYHPISQGELLGYAPVGTQINQAWTGIREFFKNKEFGLCSLTKYHIVDSKMGVRINADSVAYEVNSHLTTLNVEGSNESGFMYTVNWADSVFWNQLECAQDTFDKSIIHRMSAYASKIATQR
ncbi:hypothetical protein [Solimicrobium silvestre]|uniref:Uncharacterized protein n=1 Tax=Solimicrobium silvestre TaxID=2099400 RepID=A0A2S9GZG0_9BURK|nr:hypothetical protein [Solimicrobium silvestre]PRC93006.1 hypothetical protein S2091_2423 [Solimicrobium silvestre]